MNILMVTSEVFPFAKAGGLGDVVPQLSEALSEMGHRVIILMPLYASINRSLIKKTDRTIEVELAERRYMLGLYTSRLDKGSEVFFLENDSLYDRSGIYVDEQGQDYLDNLLRFAVLSKAAQALSHSVHIEFDVVHAHDWPSALAMIYTPAGSAKRVFSIHNIGYQGIFDYDRLSDIALTSDDAQKLGFEYFGNISLLRAALVNADALLTVSEQYAREILSEEFGFGMQDILGERREILFGILNGADYEIWDPKHDPLIPAPFDTQSIEAKYTNKQQARKQFGLGSANSPLIGIVSRLVGQKGFSLLLGENGENMRRICTDLDMQFLILGSGEKWIEDTFKSIESECSNVRVVIGYNEELSHVIQAASDFFLVPSLYEPCGLTQIYALKYGSIPIVSRRGGLIDTVRDIAKPQGTGILIGNEGDRKDLTAESLYHSLVRALELWKNRAEYQAVQRRAMMQNFSWGDSAKKYLEVYH